MPPVRPEDRQFAERLANVLRELRAAAGWTQEEAAEHIGVPVSKLGRWERHEHPPKGYDLGRAYRAYQPHGARWEWFFDPPEVVVMNPVREDLARLALKAAASSQRSIEGAVVERRGAGGKRAAQRARRQT